MNLQPAADLDSYFENGDYAAVYDCGQRMTFWTPNHHTWLSYSVEDILCRPWYDLFHRHESISHILQTRSAAMATDSAPALVHNFDVPSHVVSETFSPLKRSVTCRSKVYASLFRDGQLAGFLSINSGIALASIMQPR